MTRITRFAYCWLVGGLIGSTSMLGLASPAGAQTLGRLVQITGGDPFSDCTADLVRLQEVLLGSTLYPNTAIEPWVAVDPTEPSRLLVAHQQDRWSDGGSRGLVGVASTDGGSTWTNTIPQRVSKCTGGKSPRASDPWVTFGQDGTAFFFSLVLTPAPPTTPFGVLRSGMLVSRSTDHAATWEAPVTLIQNNSPFVLNDKNSITADPTMKGYVYAVWDQLSVSPATSKEGVGMLAENDGIVIARKLLNSTVGGSSVCAPFTKPPCKGGDPFVTFDFTGPTFLSRTMDNGDTWTPATPIYDPGVNAQTIDNIVQVLPASNGNGDVLNFFTVINATPAGLNIGYIRSTDKGASWSGPSFATDIQVVGVITPDSGQPVRDASILYAVAVDPTSGTIYLVWQDDRFSTATCTTPTGSIPIDGIAFSQSLDGGKTWSTPVMINNTPANATNP